MNCACSEEGSIDEECDENGQCNCQEGYGGLHCQNFLDCSVIDGICYRITDEKLKFEDAEKNCSELGGKLSEPMNKKEDNNVYEFVKQKYGGSREYYLGIYYDGPMGK